MPGTRRDHVMFLAGAVIGGLALALMMIARRPAYASPVIVVPQIPDPTSPDTVATIRDSLVFDLRSWPNFDERGMTRTSMRNYLRMRKTLDASRVVMHFSTGGADIRLACPGRDCQSYRQLVAAHPGETSYALVVDISDVPVGSDFDLVVEGTYVNGFRNPDSESAGTYTGSHTTPHEHLSLTVVGPDSMPFGSVRPDSDPPGRASGEGLVIGGNRRLVYWQIGDPSPETHYVLHWAW
jgi:hypothetical protein